MNQFINQQIVSDQNGKLFENQIAHHIYNLNIELLANISSQAELLVDFIVAFQFIDYGILEFKKRKRIESLEAWSKDVVKRINDFNLSRLKKNTPKLISEIHTIEELKKDFDNIVYFMNHGMELELEWKSE